MQTIEISNGIVQGHVKSILNRNIVEFLSIPYCQPPINELRFEKPQRISSFSNKIINKSQFETCPPQIPMRIFNGNNSDEETWIPTEKQDEDSLYVNIWCPLEILNGTVKYPVMIWIYGGGFVSGSSSLDIYNGSILSSKENIIVVSFNYRIAMLGFLNLDKDVVNGNLGIWDQVCALQWIHENISFFNGNPDNITIVGNSAGGCSVSLHLIIEESWKCFNKAICLSGVCFSDWAILPKEEMIKRSTIAVNKLIEKFKYPIKWDENLTKEKKLEIFHFLKKLDFNEFLLDSQLVNGITQFAWTPCVDGELIKEDLRYLFEKGKFKKCPTIFHNVENEGNFFIISRFPEIDIDNKRLIKMDYFYDSFQYFPHYPIVCSKSIQEKIKQEYCLQSNNLTIDILDKIIADQYFVCGSIDLANVISRYNDEVYYLWFDTLSSPEQWPAWCGVMHSEEIYYLFGSFLLGDSNENQKFTTSKFMEELGNFFKNGYLSRELPYYNEKSNAFIKITNGDWNSRSFSQDQIHKVEFWKELKKESI